MARRFQGNKMTELGDEFYDPEIGSLHKEKNYYDRSAMIRSIDVYEYRGERKYYGKAKQGYDLWVHTWIKVQSFEGPNAQSLYERWLNSHRG